MNNYMLVNLLIAIISIVLLILIIFKIKKLIKLRNNNVNKVDKGLNEVLPEITEEINILNEDTVERIIEEITDIDNENVTSYFEVTNSVVITNSNIII